MPRANGHEVAVQLQGTYTDMPVIYMSGYAEPLLATRSTLPAGVTMLSKPATEYQLLATVRRALDSARRQQPAPDRR